MQQVSAKLSAKVTELVNLLTEAGEKRWLAYMKDVKAKLASADVAGIDLLRKAFSGVDSFSDLVLGAAADQGMTAMFSEKDMALNTRLEDLRGEMLSLLGEKKK